MMDAPRRDGCRFLSGWCHLANMIKYAVTAVDCCILHIHMDVFLLNVLNIK